MGFPQNASGPQYSDQKQKRCFNPYYWFQFGLEESRRYDTLYRDREPQRKYL